MFKLTAKLVSYPDRTPKAIELGLFHPPVRISKKPQKSQDTHQKNKKVYAKSQDTHQKNKKV